MSVVPHPGPAAPVPPAGAAALCGFPVHLHSLTVAMTQKSLLLPNLKSVPPGAGAGHARLAGKLKSAGANDGAGDGPPADAGGPEEMARTGSPDRIAGAVVPGSSKGIEFRAGTGPEMTAARSGRRGPRSEIARRQIIDKSTKSARWN